VRGPDVLRGRSSPLNATIKMLLARTGRLAVDVNLLADDQDLYSAGLTSFATVQLMLALEEAFDVEFPERMLNRRTFASIGAIEACVSEISGAREAAA